MGYRVGDILLSPALDPNTAGIIYRIDRYESEILMAVSVYRPATDVWISGYKWHIESIIDDGDILLSKVSDLEKLFYGV